MLGGLGSKATQDENPTKGNKNHLRTESMETAIVAQTQGGHDLWPHGERDEEADQWVWEDEDGAHLDQNGAWD